MAMLLLAPAFEGLTVGARAPAPAMMAQPMKKIAVGIVGTGLVGGEFLEQLEGTRDMLKAQGLDVTVASISKTKPDADGERKPWMLCDDEEGCTLEDVEAGMKDADAGEAGDYVKMADFLKGVSDNAIIIDATASEAVSDYYATWLSKGVHVVTPNKKAGSGDLKRWKECQDAMAATGAQWGDETTVGAGLPILNVLRTDLIATGDKVGTIEGIFSGTLSYLVSQAAAAQAAAAQAAAAQAAAAQAAAAQAAAQAAVASRSLGLTHIHTHTHYLSMRSSHFSPRLLAHHTLAASRLVSRIISHLA